MLYNNINIKVKIYLLLNNFYIDDIVFINFFYLSNICRFLFYFINNILNFFFFKYDLYQFNLLRLIFEAFKVFVFAFLIISFNSYYKYNYLNCKSDFII